MPFSIAVWMKKLLLTCTVLMAVELMPAYAATYTLPLPGDQVVGQVQTAFIQPHQTIDDVAREYDVGYYEILAANPHVNPLHLMPYQAVTIPSQFILPPQPWSGIIVNIAELRLYYFPAGQHIVQTYPVAIGMEGSGTPVGHFHIIEKIIHPDWYVPASVQAEMAKQGLLLPKIMPAGPDNPLGDYALRLNKPTYLIHGTNVPATIGRRASAGCMHMFPEDIEPLFSKVPDGTNVVIIDQPFMAGWSGKLLYFKAEQPLHEERSNLAANYPRYWRETIEDALTTQNTAVKIDWHLVQQAGKEQTGVPVVIAERAVSSS